MTFVVAQAFTLASRQLENTPALLVTPSSLALLAGENARLSAVDASGRPVANVQWSIYPAVADLQTEDGEVYVHAKQSGHAILTATTEDHTASASITVASGDTLPGGTVRWSLDPLPGYETLSVAQAVLGSESGMAFYSVEWSKSSNAIVRALRDTGQQVGMTHLSSTASPLTLKHALPEPGEVFLNQARISDHSQFIIGDKSSFVLNNSTDPSFYNLPVDGKWILIGYAPDESGGIILLERGRFQDSLVDLAAADGRESWRYRSEGRLSKHWTIHYSGDVGIVETLKQPASSALLILGADTGQVRFRIPFPTSSSTIDGFRCTDPQRNVLKSVRPSLSGSVFTSEDSNIYVQVETHIESQDIEACKNRQYSFDDSLALLRVTPAGQADWKTFQHIHADGDGSFVVQPRVFAGETIPDGFGGVLAAWTYTHPGSKSGEKFHTEARLSRIGPSDQQDFTLPMPYWTPGINSFFDENMVLGEGNPLYATNGRVLIRFDTQAGVLSWLRHPPTGEVKIQHSTEGGGILVANAGRLVSFDAQGNGQNIPWTVTVTNPNGIGLAQTDLLDHTPATPLSLKELEFTELGNFIAIEDGAPNGRGSLVYFTPH
jgi:hypothetical protein